jgi:hypothetical protein
MDHSNDEEVIHGWKLQPLAQLHQGKCQPPDPAVAEFANAAQPVHASEVIRQDIAVPQL